LACWGKRPSVPDGNRYPVESRTRTTERNGDSKKQLKKMDQAHAVGRIGEEMSVVDWKTGKLHGKGGLKASGGKEIIARE